jgi:hypothetical protein
MSASGLPIAPATISYLHPQQPIFHGGRRASCRRTPPFSAIHFRPRGSEAADLLRPERSVDRERNPIVVGQRFMRESIEDRE